MAGLGHNMHFMEKLFLNSFKSTFLSFSGKNVGGLFNPAPARVSRFSKLLRVEGTSSLRIDFNNDMLNVMKMVYQDPFPV